MRFRSADVVLKKGEKPIWDAEHIFEYVSPMVSPGSGSSAGRKKCLIDYPMAYIDTNVIGCWSLETIGMAGKLLRKPPIAVKFDDEYEMRKVYSLIYDVFRYKHILCQALTDTSFYSLYPELKKDQNRVWLLLFELHARQFSKRQPEEIGLQELIYREADLEYISARLWDQRIKLAAAISRLRIKKGALQLSHLLPPHLQDEKVAVAAANPIVSGWMNPFKLKDKFTAIEMLEQMGMEEVPLDEDGAEQPLQQNQYRWDKVCPLFMSCIPRDRGEFAQSEIVKNNYFIMQDRTFSIAPAILSRLFDYFELEGDVVQTHVSSPRSTAYLAALFYSVNRVNHFLAYGAGVNLLEYRRYMETIGVNNIRLYSEKFCNIPLESASLELAVGVFATPPNSFSGVNDPIDLICSRGGDLSILEVLTESEISNEGKKRVAQLLEEQRETLRLAMSRPQVQFVLYETHSIVSSENQDMVQQAVYDINRCAFEKHLIIYKEKKRLEALAELEAANIPAAAFSQSGPQRRAAGGSAVTVGPSSATTNKSEETSSARFRKARIDSIDSSIDSDASNLDTARKSATTSSDDYAQNIKVPKTDEFMVANVPDICMNQDKCLKWNSLGCFVSLINRKQITKLDAKYLIKMAEARGLFGSSDKKKSMKPKSSKKPEKKVIIAKDDDSKKSKSKKADIAILIERLCRPTYASCYRSHQQSISSAENQLLTFNLVTKVCSRHSKHHSDEFFPYKSYGAESRAKIWWRETADYISNMRHEEDITMSQPENEEQSKPLHLTRDYNETNQAAYMMYSPGSRRRYQKFNKKQPYPVTVRYLEFKGHEMFKYRQMRRLFSESGYWST
ncbi:uncharacterized protein LOC119650170 isoform X2 [Hermetia illucens]|uniref:uncharacterized protein LOC119650170 isoform X2 n=1 Tax=Hermetia illucens TaxID=343691 RepID=UPI0018CBF52C|nr:uncharacterized protein LOC119650170 isoform X2 [Hermetia illucens]